MANINMPLKKKTILIISSFIAVLLIIILLLFMISHKTCIKYNDWAVIGHSYQEIKDKYGDFDVEFEHKVAYCIDESKYNPDYYWMVFDESKVVTKVYVAGKPGG